MVKTNYVNKIYKVPVIEIKFNKPVHVSHLNTVNKRKFKYTHYLGKPTKKDLKMKPPTVYTLNFISKNTTNPVN